LAKPFYDFSGYAVGTNATFRSSMGEPDYCYMHDVKHARIILKIGKFCAHVD